MSALIDPVTIVCAAAVLVRAVCLASHLDPSTWPGNRLQFAGFSLSVSGLGASAFGVAANLPGAGSALLVAVAGVIVFDRRKHRAPT